MPFQLKYCFLGDKITKKRVLLYLKTVFSSKNDVLVPCASKIENNTKYMYLVLDEKQLNAKRHVLCTRNENLGFARPSVTYGFGAVMQVVLVGVNNEKIRKIDTKTLTFSKSGYARLFFA